ncbi:hypothetical protein BKA70DRAFT_1431049 [Coprinopsis sp. MPI-PUGE-AT-0042]|nr:hypothetical protein BKA70DRAFT_1431049 [Coprinopsis sp. MPI-PUGE-AT-0042]
MSGLMNKRTILKFSKLFWTAFGSMKIAKPLVSLLRCRVACTTLILMMRLTSLMKPTLVITPASSPLTLSLKLCWVGFVNSKLMMRGMVVVQSRDCGGFPNRGPPGGSPPRHGPPGDPYGADDQFGNDHWEHTCRFGHFSHPWRDPT